MTSLSTAQYLALSEAAYANLSGAIASDNPDDRLIFRLTKVDKPLENKGDKPQLTALSEIADWRLIAFSGDTAFSAAAFQSPTGEIVFAFRGSDDPGDWLPNNLDIARAQPHVFNLRFDSGKQFVFNVMNQFGPVSYADQDTMFSALNQNSNVSFTGHSLGGAIAQYMTYKTSSILDGDSGVRSVTFNAVGVGWLQTWKECIRKLLRYAQNISYI